MAREHRKVKASRAKEAAQESFIPAALQGAPLPAWHTCLLSSMCRGVAGTPKLSPSGSAWHGSQQALDRALHSQKPLPPAQRGALRELHAHHELGAAWGQSVSRTQRPV